MKYRASTKEIEERLELFNKGFKFCPNCKETKSINDFAKDSRHYDGLQTNCKECCNLLRRTKWGEKIRQYAKDYYNSHPKVRSFITVDEKKCSYCKEIKSSSEFGTDKRKTDGLQSQCRKCQNLILRTKYYDRKKKSKEAWKAKNIDKVREQDKARMRQWAKDNPGRHRANCERHHGLELAAEGPYTGDQWQTLLSLCDNKCLKCGTIEDIEADHIIPLSKGGSNTIDNIQPLCKSCNCSKYNVDDTDYRSNYIKQWAETQRKKLENEES